MRAADLPDGSIVAARDVVYIKNRPSATAVWRGTNGSWAGNWKVDEALATGATVLRVGYGEHGKES